MKPSQRHPLLRWAATVTHHDLHHADARGNYALYFTWWDRWLGTLHPAYDTRRGIQRGTTSQYAR